MNAENQFELSLLNKVAAVLVVLIFCVIGFGRTWKVNDLPRLTAQDFLTSVKNGDYAAVKRCLDAGMDANTRDASHRTALYLAEAVGRDDIRQLLIARGAKQDVRDASGLETRIGVALNPGMRHYLETIDRESIRDQST